MGVRWRGRGKGEGEEEGRVEKLTPFLNRRGGTDGRLGSRSQLSAPKEPTGHVSHQGWLRQARVGLGSLGLGLHRVAKLQMLLASSKEKV